MSTYYVLSAPLEGETTTVHETGPKSCPFGVDYILVEAGNENVNKPIRISDNENGYE